MLRSSLVEQLEPRNDDADVICQLILLEHEIGQLLESNKLPDYVELQQANKGDGSA